MADPEINLSSYQDAVPMVMAATAIPIEPSSFRKSNSLTETAVNELRQQGFPLGLAQEVGNTKAIYPIRFWVVDNSGSMRTSDGNELRGSRENIQVVTCTRWRELQGAIEYHAELAGLIQATTVFRMLNDPGVTVGPQEFSVAETTNSNIQQDVQDAINIIRKAEPDGVTPLTQHVNVIRERIITVEPQLRSAGQKAVIILATDGLPSDDYGKSGEHTKNEFINALRGLQSLPVWVVVRLCTDDNEVVEYYNDLDKILELPLEVIDDFLGEAAEIYAANKWLNYALPLHRCREMGYQHRIFDLLDERLLNKDELLEFLTLLFGKAAFRSAPDIHSDWKGFSAVLEQIIKAESREWNAHTKSLGPWIDMKKLNKIYGDKKRGFLGFGRMR